MASFINNAKTTMLMALMMGLCLGIGYLMGGTNMMVMAFAFGGFMNLIMYFYSDKIALATMRAHEIDESEDPGLWQMVTVLSKRANIPMPRVYISETQAPNAFATGRNPRHSAVCVTRGLRGMLNDEELAGVIAHELGHIRHRDILISTIASMMAGAILMLTRFAFFFGGGRDRRGGNPFIALAIIILAPIAAALIQMAISRSREFEADRSAAELVGSPRGLARALEKLSYGSSRIPLAVPESQSNMFIVQPLSPRGSGLGKFFMTHPPVEQRIERLMELENNRLG